MQKESVQILAFIISLILFITSVFVLAENKKVHDIRSKEMFYKIVKINQELILLESSMNKNIINCNQKQSFD